MRRIAEYKRKSPWDGDLTDLTISEAVRCYDADPTIWAVSIVIDPDWGGRPIDDIWLARRHTRKPILVKAGREYIEWQHRCFKGWYQPNLDLGATFCLDYNAREAQEWPGVSWLEVHTPLELPDPLDWPLVIVANNRDVSDGTLRPKAAKRILHDVKDRQPGTLVCAASGYRDFDQIPEGFDLGLIGTALL